MTEEITSQEVMEWLKPVQDPELSMSLVDLGLIYGASVKEKNVNVRMTLTSPGCPAADQMISDLKDRLLQHEQVESVDVEIVWEPKWDPKVMASEECKEALGIW